MGEKITLQSKDKCTVMLAAPGDSMNVCTNQNPPTDLTVFLNKSKFDDNNNSEEQFVLPEPLG